MKLKIVDSMNDYSMDQVNCFQKPNANILNYYHNNYGSLFLIFEMLNDLYNWKNGNKFDIFYDIFRIELSTSESDEDLISIIIDSIKNKNPVLVGIDLFELFYSDENYQIVHWPHWLLITGYDKNKEVIYILDNTHLDAPESYRDFQITYGILKKSHKSFKQFFSSRDSLMIYNADNVKKNEIEVLKDILFHYLQNARSYEKEFYRINDLFSVAKELFVNNTFDNNIYNEIINNNKRREVFKTEIIKFLKKVDYNSNCVKKLAFSIDNCFKLWNKYIMRNLINFQKGEKLICIDKDIYEAEKIFLEELKKCYIFLSNNTHQLERLFLKNSTYDDLNSNIVSTKNKTVEFKFDDGKIHNWWFEDNSPKFILYAGDTKSKLITVKTRYTIEPNYKESNFQVGIYIINKSKEKAINQIFFAGIDNKDLFVLDSIGVINNNCLEHFKFRGGLYIQIVNDILTAGMIVDNKFQKRLEYYCELGEKIEIGLCCKTWGNGKYLNVLLSDYSLLFA